MPTRPFPSFGHRAGAWVCLIAYLLGGANLLPGAAAILTELDRDHRHQLSLGDGQVELRLQHEQPAGGTGCATHHHHSWAAKLLCSISCPQPREEDHVILLPMPGGVQSPRSSADGDDDDQESGPPLATGWAEGFSLSPVPAQRPALRSRCVGERGPAADHLQAFLSSTVLRM